MQKPDPGQRIRDASCPICGGQTSRLLAFTFGKKLDLPMRPDIRFCEADDFAFLTGAAQTAYDQYYSTNVNDYCRRELPAEENAPVLLQKAAIVSALGDFFSKRRRVLDFGCGEANLLELLAGAFPASEFVGYDPSPSIVKAAANVQQTSKNNLRVSDVLPSVDGQYDLIIASHVLEHIVDFSILSEFDRLLAEDGLLYVEVPDALRYTEYPRRSFLYYFDRLHVNHFSPFSLKRLLAPQGLGGAVELFYSFPYPDGFNYPALGILFTKNSQTNAAVGASGLKKQFEQYISAEQLRAKGISEALDAEDGLLVWGGGDNFHRALTNGGPLTYCRNVVLLDKTSCEITVASRHFSSIDPEVGIRQFKYPVAITVSESSAAIAEQIKKVAEDREILFL